MRKTIDLISLLSQYYENKNPWCFRRIGTIAAGQTYRDVQSPFSKARSTWHTGNGVAGKRVF